MIVTDFIDNLIDEMEHEEAINYVTSKFAEVISTIIQNPTIPRHEKEMIMEDILMVLKEYGIYDIAYILKD
jgi:hypothetical protein